MSADVAGLPDNELRMILAFAVRARHAFCAKTEVKTLQQDLLSFILFPGDHRTPTLFEIIFSFF